LAWVQVNGQYGYINPKGDFVVFPQFFMAGDFSNGLALVVVPERAGYINKQGKYAITPQFFHGKPFRENRAWVIAEGPCRWQRFFDEKEGATGDSCFGSYTLPDSAADTPILTNLLCRYALIDKSGAIISPERYVDAEDFSEGFAAVKVSKQWGYADRTGSLVIEPRFELAFPFSGGLAAVAIKGPGNPNGLRWGYIDKAGSFVIPPQFERAQSFSEGLAAVGDGGNVWFINRSGRQAIREKFFEAGRFFKGLAHVQTARGRYRNVGQFAYVNPTGKVVFRYERKEE
jgi:hypothetical protein